MTLTFPAYITVTSPNELISRDCIQHAFEIERLALRGPLTDNDRRIPHATNISWAIGAPISHNKDVDDKP